jgi:thiamine-phosphate pyrophosphorylase
LALSLNLDGAYIPSFNKDTKHLSFSIKKKFLMLGSAHNNNEIKLKERQLVKIIFLSSLFKKNKNYLGVNKFKLLSRLTNNKIIALGGVSNKNLKKLKLLNCYGFAGISFFE